ncbi:MAG: PIN domain-containing protein [Bacteroidetes bacterium]|nr:PIN domain-containing protein [Bacteroidota bacterium]MCB9344210.1 PIN domain-containing protein [Lewinellaceae bacterium]
MIHSIRFTCVLDTNVIIPIEIRDLLFWFAHDDLYTPKWSKHIFDEWEDVMRRKNVTENEIKKRIGWANLAFPDAMVENYEVLIEGLTLPDEKDCHVLATAIKVNADIIVTNNLKDFPEDYLSTFGLSAKNADDFLTETIDLNQKVAVDSFRKMVLNRRNPDLDEYEVLDCLRRNGLNDTANYLHALI